MSFPEAFSVRCFVAVSGKTDAVFAGARPGIFRGLNGSTDGDTHTLVGETDRQAHEPSPGLCFSIAFVTDWACSVIRSWNDYVYRFRATHAPPLIKV